MLYFGAPDDVVASDPSRASRGPPFVSPPRGWPGCFSSNKALKSFLGGKQQLGGKRVRLTEEPSASDLAAVAEVDWASLTVKPVTVSGGGKKVGRLCSESIDSSMDY